jgi:hypothetical protein
MTGQRKLQGFGGAGIDDAEQYTLPCANADGFSGA